jgi:hypothetical protein
VGLVGKFGFGQGKKAINSRQLPFVVLKDEVAIDPFASSSRPPQECGAGGESMWRPDVGERLRYQPTGVFDAGFTSEKVNEWKAMSGEYRDLPKRDGRWIGVYAWVFGIKQNDELEMSLAGPNNQVMYSQKLHPQTDVTDTVLWVAKRRSVLASWPLGRYVGHFRVTRNGSSVLDYTKEMELH